MVPISGSPNTSAVMGSVPADQRGVAAGMRGTFFNSGSALSIGVFFSLMIIGLAATLPHTLTSGLVAQGVPGGVAQQVGNLPPVGSLFAAFLGFNPLRELLGPSGVLQQLPAANAANMAAPVARRVAACGASGPAPGGGPTRRGTGRPGLRGAASTASLSRAPRPGKLTPTPAAPASHRRITAGRSGQVTVTNPDDGATVVVNPGQVIIVVLTGQGMLQWNRPGLAGSKPGVLRQLSTSGGYPTEAPARASFRAARAGTAEIISGSNARCLHAHPPCEIAQRLWRVTVVVR